jgi:biotin carboxyl carrier protein
MRQHVFRIGGREYQAEVKELTPERATIVIDGKEYAVDIVQLGRRQITADTVRAVPAPGPATVSAPALRPAAPQPAPASPAAARQAPPARGEGGIAAPMPGLVLSIRVKEGDTVAAGQVLLVMEAMKMENPITSPCAGSVRKLYVREGDSISEGDLLVEVARPKLTAL